MMSMRTLEDLVKDLLSPQDWLALITGSEDGPLAPCCAEVSNLRDDMVTLLSLPTSLECWRVVAHLEESSHEWGSAMSQVKDALIAWLDSDDPTWRQRVLPTDEDLKRVEARWAVGEPGGNELQESSHYLRKSAEALVELEQLSGDEQLEMLSLLKAHLASGLAAGMSPRTVLSLWSAARSLLKL